LIFSLDWEKLEQLAGLLECENALKLLFQSFAIFTKIGSPYANQAKNDITSCREKMTEY
jgi:hypothetical protein